MACTLLVLLKPSALLILTSRANISFALFAVSVIVQLSCFAAKLPSASTQVVVTLNDLFCGGEKSTSVLSPLNPLLLILKVEDPLPTTISSKCFMYDITYLLNNKPVRSIAIKTHGLIALNHVKCQCTINCFYTARINGNSDSTANTATFIVYGKHFPGTCGCGGW